MPSSTTPLRLKGESLQGKKSLAWPSSNSARHLSQTQEKQDPEAFDDGSRYFLTGNQTSKGDKWTEFKLAMFGPMRFSCPIEHLPGKSLEEREAQQLTCAATVGHKDEAFAVLQKHPHLADQALAAAAFGVAAFTTMDEYEPGTNPYMAIMLKLAAIAESNLGSRLEIVRHLFTQGASGNSTFIEQGLDFVRRKKVSVDKRMMQLLSWGSLRRWLLFQPLKLSESDGFFRALFPTLPELSGDCGSSSRHGALSGLPQGCDAVLNGEPAGS